MNNYVIRLNGLYGLDHIMAFYRSRGDCFDFVNDKDFATPVDEAEKDQILKHSDFYCKQYNASYMDCIKAS